jgi:predicted outer membrane repeat protein
LLLLLPPDAFSKSAPINGATGQLTNPSLQWNSSVGAIDYEYCFDTINNNACDTNWAGTYGVNTALQDLPPNTAFYWQVRANNTAETTYADNDTWWSFRTCTVGPITVVNTTDSGAGSLRQAILDICSGGTINFASSLSGQTITLASTLVIDKDLTIDGSSLASQVSISGNNSVRVFHINSGNSVTLNSLKVVNGNTATPDVGGSGVLNFGTLNIMNATLSGNTMNGYGGSGGGIFNVGMLDIENSIFSGNSAHQGGGLNNNVGGTVNITNSTFSENSAEYGGGIINYETLNITNSTFSSNSGISTGGGISNHGMLTITNSSLSSNSSGESSTSGSGGGIYNSGTMTTTSNTFSDNSATGQGGGIYNGNVVTIVTNTFSGNLASLYGGGIFNNGTMDITNSTFSGNIVGSVDGGGGINNAGTMNYVNTILANSPFDADCYNSGTISTNINNLIETNGPVGHTCGSPSSTGDPMLAPLANNGGSTQTMALLSGSPAIDAGDDANCPATDQRGVSRPQGSKCDIGAYEAPPYNPLYLSLTSSQTIGGVSSADEDILRFDGQNWSLFFDGSDVGVGSPDLFAFSILDADTILMSFSASVTVNGIAATPQDILRFDATSLGSTTAGTFSMYFDGSDVGFDTTAEKIDSVSLLSDGRVLISTTGNPAVTGITGGRDEDILAFTPSSLGEVTGGSWSMYFDGSDVGLGETSEEDIDALDVVNGKIYLSTLDNFSVNGMSGADEDVFVCLPTSLGSTTACNYSSSLYFDGSAWGLTSNDVDAINLLTTDSSPTPTPTNTPAGPTSTPTPTNTVGPSPTPTATASGSDLIFADGFEEGNLSAWT